MLERSAEPRPPWPRLWLVLNGIWAVLPAAVELWAAVTWLPGEAWGFEFLLFLVAPLWGVAGLLLWAQILITRTRSRAAALVTPAAFVVGVGLAAGVRAIPPMTFLPYAAGRAFARAELPPDAVFVPIESDRAYDAYGRFVREDFGRSSAAEALLPLGPEHSPWENVVAVERRAQRQEEGVPGGADLLLAVPLRDGWWYVYTAH